MSIRQKEIKAIEKINEKFDTYDWSILESDHDHLYDSIDFPEEAENIEKVFFTNTKKDLFVVIGAYRARFYIDEDKYTMEKKYFISFLNNVKGNMISIFTVSDREYWKYNFKNNVSMNGNLVDNLYHKIFNSYYGVDDLLDDFLND